LIFISFLQQNWVKRISYNYFRLQIKATFLFGKDKQRFYFLFENNFLSNLYFYDYLPTSDLYLSLSLFSPTHAQSNTHIRITHYLFHTHALTHSVSFALTQHPHTHTRTLTHIHTHTHAHTIYISHVHICVPLNCACGLFTVINKRQSKKG